ncbi:hypothetical protein, partial [Treponema pedis]|uniref:hypothetical protein n=1 Tax=Treponema pedis TaxID=409322 RepID=UPI00049434DA
IADEFTPEINVLFRQAGNNFKSAFFPVFLTKEAYSKLYIKKIIYVYESNEITVMEDAIFNLPDKIETSEWVTNGKYYCLNGWISEPENWNDKTKLWPETNFEKIFTKKKVGDEFPFKIIIYYQFDNTESKIITLNFEVIAVKGHYVYMFQ